MWPLLSTIKPELKINQSINGNPIESTAVDESFKSGLRSPLHNSDFVGISFSGKFRVLWKFCPERNLHPTTSFYLLYFLHEEYLF